METFLGGHEKSKHILVIEDNADLAQVLMLLLNRMEFAVSTALSGEQGFDQLRRRKPDLVILDYPFLG